MMKAEDCLILRLGEVWAWPEMFPGSSWGSSDTIPASCGAWLLGLWSCCAEWCWLVCHVYIALTVTELSPLPLPFL